MLPNALAIASPTSVPGSSPSAASPFFLRATLLLSTAAVALVAGALASGYHPAGFAAELAFLLRGMALIKASIAIVAIALALWRFGYRVSLAAAGGYILGVGCLVAASMFIWFLTYIAFAAILFHVGLFGLLIIAWREDGSAWRHPNVNANGATPGDAEHAPNPFNSG